MRALPLGIDLGTSNSSVAIWRDGKVDVVRDENGESLQASVVSFLADGRVLVGNAARMRAGAAPTETVLSSKRLMGRPIYSPEAVESQRRMACVLDEGPGRSCVFSVHGRHYAPEEIGALILGRMADIAEEHLGVRSRQAVLTVPANFREAQRSATMRAGQRAGLEVLRLLNEPTAAALAYGFGEKPSRRMIAVFDLGGGTFDMTLLEQRGEVFEVRSTAGDTFLGGDDIDERLAEAMAGAFLIQTGVNPRSDKSLWQRLRAVGEAIKCRLSHETEVVVEVSEHLAGVSRPVAVTFSFDRSAFESWCEPLLRRTLVTCDEALRLARVSAEEIEEVVLVGGSTRIPLLQEMVAQYFSRQPLMRLDPGLVVSLGAAIYAGSLTAISYGDGIASYAPPIRYSGGTVRTEAFDGAVLPLDALDGSEEVEALTTWEHPEEPDTLHTGAVPSLREGEVGLRVGSLPLLIDVTSHAIGIATLGGLFDAIIPRNAKVPTEHTRSFTTTRDGQDSVLLQVYEGSARLTKDNHKLGELALRGLRKARRGATKVLVTLSLDTNAMLHVVAVDSETGQSAQCDLVVAGLAPT